MVSKTLVASVMAWVLLGGTAAAKDEPQALVVCGLESCQELRGEAVGLASTITMHAGRRPQSAAPFYDVFLVFREPGGRTFAGDGALRYVPAAQIVGSHSASGEAIWFRADPALAMTLRRATNGISPRPARALDDPSSRLGRATLAAQRALTAQASAPIDARASSGRESAVAVRLLFAFGALTLAIIASLVWHRRRRGPQSSITRGQTA